MKKILALFIAVLSIFTFSGCIVVDAPFQTLQSPDKIDNIYVYYLEEAIDAHAIKDFPKPTAQLEENEFGSFIQEAEELPYKDHWILAPYTPNWNYSGYVAKIEYADGSYDAISFYLRSSFSAQEEKYRMDYGSFEEEVWLAFLQKYMDIQEKTAE